MILKIINLDPAELDKHYKAIKQSKRISQKYAKVPMKGGGFYERRNKNQYRPKGTEGGNVYYEKHTNRMDTDHRKWYNEGGEAGKYEVGDIFKRKLPSNLNAAQRKASERTGRPYEITEINYNEGWVEFNNQPNNKMKISSIDWLISEGNHEYLPKVKAGCGCKLEKGGKSGSCGCGCKLEKGGKAGSCGCGCNLEKGGEAGKADKIKTSFYKWGQYLEDDEIDAMDLLPLIELTQEQLLGFDIREEDADKYFYASDNDIDEDDDEGVSVKRAWAVSERHDTYKKGGKTGELPKVGYFIQLNEDPKEDPSKVVRYYQIGIETPNGFTGVAYDYVGGGSFDTVWVFDNNVPYEEDEDDNDVDSLMGRVKDSITKLYGSDYSEKLMKSINDLDSKLFQYDDASGDLMYKGKSPYKVFLAGGKFPRFNFGNTIFAKGGSATSKVQEAEKKLREAKKSKITSAIDEASRNLDKAYLEDSKMKKGGKTGSGWVVGDILKSKKGDSYVTIIDTEKREKGISVFQSNKDGKATEDENGLGYSMYFWDYEWENWEKVGHTELEKVTNHGITYYKSGNEKLDVKMSVLDGRYKFFVENAPKNLKNKFDRLQDDNYHYACAELVNDFFSHPEWKHLKNHKLVAEEGMLIGGSFTYSIGGL
jgi:hypothetical protein